MAHFGERERHSRPLQKQVLIRLALDVRGVGERLGEARRLCADQMRLLAEAAEAAGAIRERQILRAKDEQHAFASLVREMTALHEAARRQLAAVGGVAAKFAAIAREVEREVGRLKPHLRDPRQLNAPASMADPAIVPLHPYRKARGDARAAQQQAEQMSLSLVRLGNALADLTAAQLSNADAIASLHARMAACLTALGPLAE